MICLRFQLNGARLNSRVNSLPLRPRTTSFEGIKFWVNSVHIGSDTSCSFFPLLLYSACIYSSLFFSTLVFLLYLLHPSDSFPFSSLLFSCSLFKCTCPKFKCNSWYRISGQGVKSWVNSVHVGSDTSCSFFPLLLYSACIYSSLFFSTLFFSFTFSILLILSLSLLYSFHVVSLSAIARSLTVIVDIGSLDKELNLELILFILALIPPALSVGIGSLEKELNLELILFKLSLIPPALSSLFSPTLLVFIFPSSFQLFYFSSTFSILLILSLSHLYSFHVVSLSGIARSLTVIVDIESLDKELNLELILFILALIPPALSVGIGSLEKELNLELILFLLTLIPPALSVGIGSLEKELNLELILFKLSLIPPALSSLFFPTLLVFIFPSSFQLFYFSSTFSILLILSLSHLYSFM